jgi:hypothetical protein
LANKFIAPSMHVQIDFFSNFHCFVETVSVKKKTIPKVYCHTVLKDQVKAANDLRLQHVLKLNNLRYWATAAENALSFYRIDILALTLLTDQFA